MTSITTSEGFSELPFLCIVSRLYTHRRNSHALRICKYDLFRRLWLYVYLAIVRVGYIFQPVRVLHEICSAKFVGRYNPKAKKGDDSMGIMYMQPSYIQILIAEGQKRSI